MVFYNHHSDDRTGDRWEETGGRDSRRKQRDPSRREVED